MATGVEYMVRDLTQHYDVAVQWLHASALDPIGAALRAQWICEEYV
jgi:hypothetical protein